MEKNCWPKDDADIVVAGEGEEDEVGGVDIEADAGYRCLLPVTGSIARWPDEGAGADETLLSFLRFGVALKAYGDTGPVEVPR